MPYDWNFSPFTHEDLTEMREQRKQEAERKRQKRREEMQPMIDEFTRLYDQ